MKSYKRLKEHASAIRQAFYDTSIEDLATQFETTPESIRAILANRTHFDEDYEQPKKLRDEWLECLRLKSEGETWKRIGEIMGEKMDRKPYSPNAVKHHAKAKYEEILGKHKQKT